jgi:Ca2+-binding RTX toxin-like protein
MTLEAGAERGRLLGAGHLDLQGNAAANMLDGNKGDNLLQGQGANDRLLGWGGADRLYGGAGSDRLEGGIGHDTLRGGTGADRFVFWDRAGSTTGTDRILDLAPGDLIQIDLLGVLPAEAPWEDSHVAATADGWQITLDDGSAILLNGGLSRAQVEAAIDLL